MYKLKKSASPSKELLKAGEKTKRGKVRTRSPLQNHKKKSPPSLVRSPAIGDQCLDEMDRKEETRTVSSDESSSGICGEQGLGQTSPRKAKKINNNRRKSTPRSPTGQRMRRRSGSNEDKPSSLPGSLPRRRSSTVHGKSGTEEEGAKNRLSPHR